MERMERTDKQQTDSTNWKQRRIAVINDLSCYGRCSLTVALPIISSMGIECCPLPTVLLSTNGAFPGCVTCDMTEFMERTTNHFEELSLSFDGIMSGFYNSVSQIAVTEKLFQGIKQQKKETLLFIDPIMGDHGKLYSVSTEEVCEGIRRLLAYADVVTPNLTECCRLIGCDYPVTTPTASELTNMAQRLHELGPKRVVITGLNRGDTIENFVSEQGHTQSIVTPRIGRERSGTGDVFMSVLAGSMIQGQKFLAAIHRSVEFVQRAIAVTEELQVPNKNGVCFELCLKDLC